MKYRRLSLLIVCWTMVVAPLRCASAQSFQAPCKTAQEFAALPQNMSTLIVQLALKNGRLVVDPAKTKSSLSQRFKCTAKVMSEDQARRILIDDLNGLFAGMPQVYFYGLTTALKKQDQANKLNDPDTTAIRQFTGDWQSFSTAYDKWANKLMPPNKTGRVGAALSNYVNDLQVGRDLGALTFVDPSSAFPPISNPDSKRGALTFNVTDAISGWVDPLDPSTAANQFKVGTQNPTSPQHIHELIRVLKPLQGHLWRRKEIVDLLEDFYLPQGLTQPQVFLMDTTATIQESVRIGRVVICPATVKKTTTEILLYSLLSTSDFEAFLKGGSNFAKVNVPDPCLSFSYPAGREPLLNYNVFQAQQGAVSALGFDTVATPADSNGIATLLLRQGSSSAKATSGKTGTTPSQAATTNTSAHAQPVGAPSASTANAVPAPAPTATSSAPDTQPAAADTAVAPPKLLNNFIGAGLDYRPGQGVRPFATYTRERLHALSDQDSLTLTAGANGKALGALDYTSDFAFFGALHHHLSLHFSGSSDFQEKRFLFGGLTDERRTGALLHASYELFRDLNHMQLQISADGRQTRVLLSPAGLPSSTTNLTTLDLGATFVLDQLSGRFGRHLEITPTVRLGLPLTDNEPSYQTAKLTGSFQQNLPKLYQLHFNGSAQFATTGTPVFELPSFGGDGSVRGFRRDDGLGRTVLSLQSELWNPIPGFSNSSGKIGQFVHRNVWLAAFFDAGGIFQAVDPVSGARQGAGIGARVNYRLVIFKLDWAYGIGTGRTGDGRGRTYFSISNWLPL